MAVKRKNEMNLFYYEIKLAKSMGIRTSVESIQAIINEPNRCDIVFDAIFAGTHRMHAPILKKFTIDLTPANVGIMCIPVLNMQECIKEDKVNLITCEGQATIFLRSQQ